MASETIKRIVGFVDFFSDDTRNGYKIPQSEYAANGRNLIIDQGDNEIAGYSDRDEGLYTSVPAVVFGDHTRIIKYVDKPFFIGADGVKILKPQRGVDPKYAYYALKAARIESLGYSRHFKVVKELHFVLPDDVVQKRIAAALDKISEMKRNAEARLQKLDLLVKARFNEMFGDPIANDKAWNCKPLLEILKDDTRLATKLPTSEYLDRGCCPIVDQGKSLVAGYTDSTEGVYINVPAIVFGDHTCIWKYIDEPFILGADGAKILNVKCSDVDLRYIYEALKFYNIPDTGYSRHFKWVKEFVLPLPPFKAQRSFSAFVDEVESQKSIAQKELEKVDLLYRAKLQEYFG